MSETVSRNLRDAVTAAVVAEMIRGQTMTPDRADIRWSHVGSEAATIADSILDGIEAKRFKDDDAIPS